MFDLSLNREKIQLNWETITFFMNDYFNPIQDGIFWGCSWMGAGGFVSPSLKSVTYILQYETWQS